MNITKIARLLSAQTEPVRSQQIANQTETPVLQDNEAVSVAGNFGSGSGDGSDARAEKIAKLTEAVKSGSYNPDPREVAAAVYKDLFI